MALDALPPDPRHVPAAVFAPRASSPLRMVMAPPIAGGLALLAVGWSTAVFATFLVLRPQWAWTALVMGFSALAVLGVAEWRVRRREVAAWLGGRRW